MTVHGIVCLMTLDMSEETMGENPLEVPQPQHLGHMPSGFQSNSPLGTDLQPHVFKNDDDGTVQSKI